MAAKIKDGLFIGDAETSQDAEFLELNKINSLINLAGREVPNVWAAHGLVYNTYNWEDREGFKPFDAKNEVLSEIVLFIDKSMRHGSSVLIFSTRGTGRCTAAACAYLMFKYGWGFEKTYDFIYSKKPDVELNRGFVEELFLLDKKLRIKRFQGRDGSALTPWEVIRVTGWDPRYLTESDEAQTASHFGSSRDGHSQRAAAASSALASSHLLAENTTADELLMVHSYVNSKLTITSLPGPFHEALREHKNFTLQFNLAENKEAGVHLRRTAPPPPTLKPPRGGILKTADRNTCAQSGKLGSGRERDWEGAGRSERRKGKEEGGRKTDRGSEGRRSTLRDLEESDSSSGEEGVGRHGGILAAEKEVSSAAAVNRGDGDQAKGRGEFYCPLSPSALSAESISMLSDGKDDPDDQADSLLLSSVPRASGHTEKTSRGLEGDSLSSTSLGGMHSQFSHQSDLYDFVGLSSSQSSHPFAPSTDPPERTAHHDHRGRERHAAESKGHRLQTDRREEELLRLGGPGGVGREAARGTPAERLHSLLGDLQKGKSAARPQYADAKSSRGSEPSRDFKRGRMATRQSDAVPPSIHDVASMPIAPAFHSSSSVPSSGGTNTFLSVGANQPVRARPDVMLTGWSGGAQQAWTSSRSKNGHGQSNERGSDRSEQPHAHYYNHSGGRAKPSGGGSRSLGVSGKKLSSAEGSAADNARRPYRHGSPAPQMSKTGLASRAQHRARQSNSGSVNTEAEEDTDGYTAKQSHRSSVPGKTYSNGSGGTSSSKRPATPPRQRTPRSSSQSQTFLHPTASSQRRASVGEDSAARSSGGSRRAATPTRADGGGGAGRNPSPQRGWKY